MALEQSARDHPTDRASDRLARRPTRPGDPERSPRHARVERVQLPLGGADGVPRRSPPRDHRGDGLAAGARPDRANARADLRRGYLGDAHRPTDRDRTSDVVLRRRAPAGWHPSAEQEGVGALFAGAYAVLRNPAGHREVRYDDVSEAADGVQTASLLMRILDRVEQRVTGRTSQNHIRSADATVEGPSSPPRERRPTPDPNRARRTSRLAGRFGTFAR